MSFFKTKTEPSLEDILEGNDEVAGLRYSWTANKQWPTGHYPYSVKVILEGREFYAGSAANEKDCDRTAKAAAKRYVKSHPMPQSLEGEGVV